ncbi:MAG: hypothetical protein NZ811_06140 [Gammaproteobacteria bacterium]|nr:hypothetical protein [Gammaproteobacteria bacterium]
MKPKDIELKLGIKNYKVGKFLHLLALDIIGDFERSHPRIIPSMLASLEFGDPKQSYEKVESLKEIVKTLHTSVENLSELVEEYMLSEIAPPKKGKGSQFITPEGGIGIAFVKGEESVAVETGSSPKKKVTKSKKKKPAKKRASKKKTKEE